jgi:hypothetical protein
VDAHRVFVIWNHPLFFEFIRLLLEKANVRWIGSSHGSDHKFAEIHQLKPDTILVEEEEDGNIPTTVLELMETSAANIRIFRLSMADNDLKIYHREKKTMLQAEDLLNLITEGE